MKIEFLKDVLTPESGVGRIGQIAEMDPHNAKHYLNKGLAKEAPADAPVSDVKEDDKPKKRDKKPAAGPTETKGAPNGVVTTSSLSTPATT